MRNNEEIIRQAARSRSMMDFYMIQLEILLDIRTLVKELIETSSVNLRVEEKKWP
jgi:thiazole synthase ThiGH ThiG subunit